ncbi:aminoglycoside phosphotransferase family protein [Gordonia sp. PP30]|uniref:phosphotransferase n=1 Tax=unclassified Gordonia (in: high G+C Gram-positive bacteria) TaxID=2657482 RepID=UPI001FFEF8D7|nr:phosphotransferase [Gordonia sp. PP30]UQE76557.1 aminoglycoside phosphotransferase family protein [Gordonia sp. PP30]
MARDGIDSSPPSTILDLVESRLGRSTAVRPYEREQRHQSWRITTAAGEFWLKLEGGGTAFACLTNEAQALRDLAHTANVPELVLDGTVNDVDFLVTRHRPGLPLDQVPDLSAHHIAALLGQLDFLHTSTSSTTPVHQIEQASLYAPNADPVSCVNAVHRRLRSSVSNHRLDELVDLVSTMGPRGSRPPVRVHGSSDPSNILVSGDGSVSFLDWEACRLGPAGIDRAAVTFGLLSMGRPDLAEVAFSGSSHTAGFLVLRLLYLQSNGRLQDRLISAVTRLLHRET